MIPDAHHSDHAGKWFAFHLIVTILAWVGPFLFSWYLMLPAYGIVMLQFLVFDRCLVNARHGLKEDDQMTFYALLFELMGFRCNRKKVKRIVRTYLYPFLALFTCIWQLLIDVRPLLF